MNCIFLDVDGVINNPNTKEKSIDGYIGVDVELVKLLKGTSNNFVILGMTPCGIPNKSAFRKINFAKAYLLEVSLRKLLMKQMQKLF